jgi:type II secretory pathway pseudopilin PulG
MKYQKGFSLIEGLLLILVLAVVGLGGWYAWDKNQKSESEQTQEIVEQGGSAGVAKQEISSRNNNVSSISCIELNTQSTIESGKDAEWKKRVETASEISELIASYNDSLTYETYFGSECLLDDGTQIVSYSHHTSDSTYTKGLIWFEGNTKILVDTDSTCENEEPDRTAPATIIKVESGIVFLTCGGYSAKQVQFDLVKGSYFE